jgi:chromosome segregation ATPase
MKELEVIEEQWRAETKELLAVVSRLQEENRRLAKDASPSHQPLSPTLQHGNGDVLQKLKDSVEKQRDEIRIKDKLLQDKCCDIDNLKSQVERLNSTSRELRRKHKLFQSQVRTLCEERADFLVQLQDQQRDIMGLRQRLGLAQKENEDLTKVHIINIFVPLQVALVMVLTHCTTIQTQGRRTSANIKRLIISSLIVYFSKQMINIDILTIIYY